MKVDWVRKISSRKFWVLVAVMVASIMTVFGASQEVELQITGLITATGSVITYILAEAHVDASQGRRGRED